MKYILFLTVIFFTTSIVHAQKYVLLDKHMANKPKLANNITSTEKFNNFLPVERKYLPEFVKSLEEIAGLLNKNNKGQIKNYAFGCMKIKGRLVPLRSGPRLDYIITSTCDNINIEMHISDAKLDNKNNYYFINTWIKYIKNNLKI
ncbi:MAG: hypothetical protein ACMG51_03190 [Ginsengibacter sp.]